MIKIPLLDIVMGLSSAIDLVSHQLSNHQIRVAYIACSISKELGFNEEDRKNIIYASLLHDCGALNDKEKFITLEFDFGENLTNRYSHSYRGWQLIRDIEDLRPAAEIIKYHHVYWDERNGEIMSKYKIPAGSYIVHLADRIDISLDKKREVLEQRDFVINRIKGEKGRMFMPEAVDAFLNISAREYFWFDLVSLQIENIVRDFLKGDNSTIDINKMISIASTIYQIIDFRSVFTATHSIGVAESARILSSKMNFCKQDVQLMYIAGLMHDIGKLAVPLSILEKNGPLSQNEFSVIKRHTLDSYRIIERIPQMEKVNKWASYHHESMDGKGYPFKLQESELDTGSRIMAVCDVFTALTEHRPYRQAMSLDNSIRTMERMALERRLDGDILKELKVHIEEINHSKNEVQNKAFQLHKGLNIY